MKSTSYHFPHSPSWNVPTDVFFSRYYLGYVEFFTEAVKEHGIAEAVEEYVFSDKVNVPNGDERPEMLARFLAGLLHPFIHSGYGFEFNSPVMAVEGRGRLLFFFFRNVALTATDHLLLKVLPSRLFMVSLRVIFYLIISSKKILVPSLRSSRRTDLPKVSTRLT